MTQGVFHVGETLAAQRGRQAPHTCPVPLLCTKVDKQPQDALTGIIRQIEGLFLSHGKAVLRLFALSLLQNVQGVLLTGGFRLLFFSSLEAGQGLFEAGDSSFPLSGLFQTKRLVIQQRSRPLS